MLSFNKALRGRIKNVQYHPSTIEACMHIVKRCFRSTARKDFCRAVPRHRYQRRDRSPEPLGVGFVEDTLSAARGGIPPTRQRVFYPELSAWKS